MTSYTQSERNIISNRQGKNEKYREPTATVNSRQKDLEFSRNTAFLQQRKTSSKFRVPFIPDANVGADDFSAQRCRRFCHMQGLITVESHGQVCMSGPLSHFAGVSVDAAGQVYSQNKSAAFVQTVHQPAGGKAGGPQCAMESGAVCKNRQ